MGSTVGQLVELLAHSTRDMGLILTWAAICVKFV